MIKDILTAVPWGLLLAFSIGPGFFVLLETSITKGFRAAFTLDLGIVFADIVFILIAYFSTSHILEQLKDNPILFILGGLIMMLYGIISLFILYKQNKKIKADFNDDNIPKNNYLALFFKGFLLNFINIGVLGFWMVIILTYGPQVQMKIQRLLLFFCSILIFYLFFDVIKILLAKQLKNKLTQNVIFKLKRVISVIITIFGLFFILQGFFPNEKDIIKDKIEQLNK